MLKCTLDFAASNFDAGISGGLGGKIVRIGMDNDRFTYNFFYSKTFVIKGRPGVPLIAKKRKQIACMIRVERSLWIVMFPCILEVARTVAKIVDMEGIEVTGSFFGNIGQSKNFRFYQYAAVRGGIKFYKAAQSWMFCISCNPCGCAGPLIR